MSLISASKKSILIKKKECTKSVDDSHLNYFKDKGSIKITIKLEALGRSLLSGAID